MSQDQETKTLEQIVNHLEEKTRGLDGETLSRLNQARQTAIQRTGKTYRHWLIPATGLTATAGVAVLSFSIWTSTTINTQIEPSILEDIELLSGNEELELFDDLAFYEWLENEKQAS